MPSMRSQSVEQLSLDQAATDSFRSGFNNAGFEFRHNLHTHPLFELSNLVELDRSLSGRKYHDAGAVGVADRWDGIPPSPLTSAQVLQQIETADAWLLIRDAQRVSEYNRLLEDLMCEAEDLVGHSFRKHMRHQEMLIFVTSPKRVTPFHIDRECSFLLQIRGRKTIFLFDRNDRDVLREEELERFWTIDNNAPRYREQFQARSRAYILEPGIGVHIPVNFPHWLKNENNVSISVNINIQFAEHVRGDIYRANHILRQFGIRPKPPGHRADPIKAFVAGRIRDAKQGLQSLRANFPNKKA